MSAGTITIIQGEDFTLNLAFTNADGSAYNLTGCSVSLVVRKNVLSAPVINRAAAFTSAPGGLASIPLSEADTDLAIRAWQYQIILVDSLAETRPSLVNYLRVTKQGTTTTGVTVTIGSNDVSVSLTLAGAAGIGVPLGGTTGQVLQKNSNTNFDTGWTNTVNSVAGRTGAVTLAKSDVGLGNVDNTSDSTKNSATASLTNKVISGSANTLTNIPEGAVTNLTTDLASKEPSVAAGTTNQYYRGDKSFQTLDKTAVGLANVDNTSDANKPVSTATQTALNAKLSNITGLVTAGSNVTVAGSGTSGSPYQISAATQGLTPQTAIDSLYLRDSDGFVWKFVVETDGRWNSTYGSGSPYGLLLTLTRP